MWRSNRPREAAQTFGTEVSVWPPNASTPGRPLSTLTAGTTGRVLRVTRDLTQRAERLAILGVSAGATIRVLQTFPGIVFECDQTELAVEREVAGVILVEVD
jgi:Fe2+ transport system protein FeoA